MKPEPAPAPTGAAAISKSEEAEEDAPPAPGAAEWKDTYDNYLSEWQAESSIARQKSEEVRKRIEDEAAAKEKAAADEIKAKKRAEQEAKLRKEREAKLQKELEQSGSSRSGLAKRKGDLGREERERKVKEAWEMVKGAGEGKQGDEVVTDGRGVTDADIKAGNVEIVGQEKEKASKSVCYHVSTTSHRGLTLITVVWLRSHDVKRPTAPLDARPATFAHTPHAKLVADIVTTLGHFTSMDRSLWQHLVSRGSLSSSIRLIR
jgi:hypothetical protein